MDLNSLYDLKRLEEQIFQNKPTIKSSKQKKYVSNRLRNQLVESKAVVKIQRLDVECESLMISLKKRLMLLQDFIIPNDKKNLLKSQAEYKSNLSSESSDDETLGLLISKQKNEEMQDINMSPNTEMKIKEMQAADTSEYAESEIPLALRRKPRERRLSFKSYSSASTSRSRANRTKLQKQKHSVINSIEEHLVDKDELGAPTLHVKIPSLYRGNVHCIILDSLNFGRKIFDYRANEAKQQQQQQKLVSHKKQFASVSSPDVQQLNQPEQDCELSQFIQDVMAEACNDETLQATSALESINNNLTDNYDLVENDTVISYSQSSKELSYPQNFNRNVDPVCSTSDGAKTRKKRKYTKRSNQDKQDEPLKKRGRRKGTNKGSNTIQLQSQPPTKSNLAQYVELFSNDCEILPPGSTTPAASSTRSLPLVSSTTHNFEVVDQLAQQEEQISSQHPITYYIDGDWANGGPCQLVSTNQDDNVPVQNFVNYIDNSPDSRNNIISTVLQGNRSLPVSIPQSISNDAYHNENHQPRQQLYNMSTVQNSLLPIINIHIPPLPNNIISSEPPPAHVHKEVVDLSINSINESNSATSTEAFNLVKKSNIDKDYECLPLDLSAKGGYEEENNSVTIDSQDEDFIRRLIEQSDFNYTTEEFKKKDENINALYNHENNKSFKAALDMPILDFNTTDLAQLVESTCNQEQNVLTDKIVYNESADNEDSNLATITAVNLSLEKDLNFSDQSATEIFNKLLDICPDKHFLNDMNIEIIRNDNLNEKIIFDQNCVEISTMCAVENATTEKNKITDAKKGVYKGICENSQEIEIISNVELNSSNTTNDMSLNLMFSNSDSSELNNSNITEEINTTSPSSCENNIEICNTDVNSSTVGKSKIGSRNNKSDPNDVTIDKPDVFESTFSKLPLGATKNRSDISYKDLSYSLSKQKLNSNLISESSKTKLNTNANTNDILLLEKKDAEPSQECFQVQSKENIVFSVAKITSSEDDIIYTSDSDLSSGKPCYLSEVKNTDCDYIIENKTPLSFNLTTESVSLKDDTAPVNNDLNSYTNKERKIVNIDQELADDTFKNVDCSKDKNMEDETNALLNSNISNENLSLLDLESKLECPLDFNEDFDDALSLATSCFDSPNDDRFESALVDFNTTTAINTLQDFHQHESCPNAPQTKDLKPFKIPKLSNSDSITVPIISEEVKFENSSPKKTSNIGKLTRTITIDANVPLKENVLEKRITIRENVIHNIFGITCLSFLVDKCNGLTQCRLSHQLYDTERVFRNLNTLDKTHANSAYQVMYNHSKLFKLYFNIFCTYYTKKNDRIKLFNMVNDCERYPECAEFLIAIYEGLVECGLSRINACRLILKCIREKNITTSIVEALVAIIMKSDWTMFTDFIKKFTEDMYQFKFSICILEQMAPAVLNSNGSLLKQVFLKCFQTLHCADTALLLNSPIIIQCMALLTSNT